MFEANDKPSIESLLQEASLTLQQISESARLDAELLLSHALKISREQIFSRFQQVLSASELKDFDSLVAKRQQGEPVAYLVGAKDFWKHSFFVNNNVLIPRPDSEILVEESAKFLSKRAGPLKALDLGTGSGCLAISLALELGDRIELLAVDKSQHALEVACQNAKKLGANNVSFLQSDWYSSLDKAMDFDLIVSNPPYLSFEQRPELAPDLSFEPSQALFAEDSGLSDIKIIVKGAQQFLKPGGMLICEIQPAQQKAIDYISLSDGLNFLNFYNDLARQCRAFSVRKG
jgi:release factor glutamine methyltransferase